MRMPSEPHRLRPPPDWQLDRRIGLPLLVTLMLQTGIGLVWVGAIGQRVHTLEQNTTGLTVLLERTARLEEQIAAIRRSVQRLETKFDAFTAQTAPQEGSR